MLSIRADTFTVAKLIRLVGFGLRCRHHRPSRRPICSWQAVPLASSLGNIEEDDELSDASFRLILAE